MLEKHTTSFIQRHILQKLGQFLLQKSEVRLSCKTTFQDERTFQLIVQNCTPHIDTETLLKVAFNSGVGILICPHMRIVCIIHTVAIELHFVCKHDVTMQLATAIEPLAKVQPLSKIARSEMLHSLHVVWIHALCMQCSLHSRVGNTKMSCNSSRTRTWTAVYHMNNAFFIDAFINPLEHTVVSDATSLAIRFNMQSSARRLRHRCRLLVILAFCQ